MIRRTACSGRWSPPERILLHAPANDTPAPRRGCRWLHAPAAARTRHEPTRARAVQVPFLQDVLAILYRMDDDAEFVAPDGDAPQPVEQAQVA